MPDNGYRFKCPSFVHVSKQVNCSLDVYLLNGSLNIEIYYGDGTNRNLTLNKIENVLNKTYGSVGVYTVTLRIPSKELEFNQTVRIHGNIRHLFCLFI
jgi:hypothetical protein